MITSIFNLFFYYFLKNYKTNVLVILKHHNKVENLQYLVMKISIILTKTEKVYYLIRIFHNQI